MEINPNLTPILDTLPLKPGCYLMKDENGKVIYVGKAINLRNRVRSYFHSGGRNHPRIQQLVLNIANIEWILVDSELEALILEMNLIKKFRPHFNIRLKDDKRYPYIKVHWGVNYPKVTITRQMTQDGSRYFGPYTSVWALHQTLDFLRKIFPYLSCDREITGNDDRACLYYDIKLCTAPCIGAISQENYRFMINEFCEFLQGRTEKIIARMQIEMDQASQNLNFERAALIRDQIQAAESVVEKQKIISSDYIDSDVIALARSNNDACVQVFFIRSGKLIGREYFLLEGTTESNDANVISEFIKQFYDQTPSIPNQVLLPHEIEEAQIIKQWLNQKSTGGNVEFIIPTQGQQKELVALATENAIETLAALQAQWQADQHKQETALHELQEVLKIESPLNRIECFDISNTQGTASVGSMVVFEHGTSKRNHYRSFNIREVVGSDDFASMEEVLKRRFNRWQSIQEAKDTPNKKTDPSFALLPNLLIVDGGKGQLNRAVKILDLYHLAEVIPVIGLAKKNEEVFVPGKTDPIVISQHSQGSFLIQRIRDEAHRFAITAHRKQRTRKGLASQLDSIPGIGPARRKMLIGHFGSIDGIRQAKLEDLSSISGITDQLAEKIKEHLG
jgi:excinuclease ABC subunit C